MQDLTSNYMDKIEEKNIREVLIPAELVKDLEDQIVNLLLIQLKSYGEAKYREGQMNPSVGFLRQYLNEQPMPADMWTDEDIIRFLRIPFKK